MRSAPERIFAAQHADQKRPKPWRCQPIAVAALMMEPRDSQPFQTEEKPGPEKAVRGGQLRAFDGALQACTLLRTPRRVNTQVASESTIMVLNA